MAATIRVGCSPRLNARVFPGVGWQRMSRSAGAQKEWSSLQAWQRLTLRKGLHRAGASHQHLAQPGEWLRERKREGAGREVRRAGSHTFPPLWVTPSVSPTEQSLFRKHTLSNALSSGVANQWSSKFPIQDSKVLLLLWAERAAWKNEASQITPRSEWRKRDGEMQWRVLDLGPIRDQSEGGPQSQTAEQNACYALEGSDLKQK